MRLFTKFRNAGNFLISFLLRARLGNSWPVLFFKEVGLFSRPKRTKSHRRNKKHKVRVNTKRRRDTRARRRDDVGDLIRVCKYTTTAKLNDIKTPRSMTRPIFFPATHKSERARRGEAKRGERTRDERRVPSDLALIAFLSWPSQKKILSDLIRQKRARESAPGPERSDGNRTERSPRAAPAEIIRPPIYYF